MRSSVFCSACLVVFGFVSSLEAQPVATHFSPPVWPVDQSQNGFSNEANPFMALYRGKYHMGEDWNKNKGGSSDYGDPVYPIAVGKVMKAVDQGGSIGKVVVIKHLLPDSQVVYSYYFHLSKISVKVNDIVYSNKPLGNIGDANGHYAGKAHLHFEIRRVNQPISSSLYGNLTIATAQKYLDPSLFLNDRMDWVGFFSCGGFSSSDEFVVPDYAPASLAYMTYGGRTLSLPLAIDAGWIDPTVDVWEHGTSRPRSEELASFIFGPTTDFVVTLPDEACNLTILVPGHNFQKSRARNDMIRVAKEAGLIRIKLETLSGFDDPLSADYDLRYLCFDYGANTAVACIVHATDQENPLNRWVIWYDPIYETSLGDWTELDPNDLD